MARTEDAERLKYLAARIAALRGELAELRTEREAVLLRLRTLPHPEPAKGRMAVRVSYGEDGEGLLLVDLPGKAAVAARDGGTAGAVAPSSKASAVEPDIEDR